MAKRGKTQARRNSGNGGLPGWAWGVFGIVIGIVLILAAPKVLKDDGDGFLRPRANPDATPAPVETADDELGAPEANERGATERAATASDPDAAPARKPTDFDFYTLLPGREVPFSDAELAETVRAEAAREAKAAAAAQAADAALPAPVDDAPARPATAPPSMPAVAPTERADTAAVPAAGAAAPADDDTRYLLQAGAFEASGQAEELKAKIAMLGVGARVESAQIRGKTVFRVRMGPYGSASELAEAKRKLASGGLPAMAIKVE